MIINCTVALWLNAAFVPSIASNVSNATIPILFNPLVCFLPVLLHCSSLHPFSPSSPQTCPMHPFFHHLQHLQHIYLFSTGAFLTSNPLISTLLTFHPLYTRIAAQCCLHPPPLLPICPTPLFPACPLYRYVSHSLGLFHDATLTILWYILFSHFGCIRASFSPLNVLFGALQSSSFPWWPAHSMYCYVLATFCFIRTCFSSVNAAFLPSKTSNSSLASLSTFSNTLVRVSLTIPLFSGLALPSHPSNLYSGRLCTYPASVPSL